jgi:hypothetical protein
VTVSLAGPSAGWAAPIDVEVLSAQYETFVSTGYVTETSTFSDSRTQLGGQPLADLLQVNGVDWARAEARSFSLANFSDSNSQDGISSTSSSTIAKTVLEFAPVVDASGTLTLQVTGRLQWLFSEGYAQLLDLTAGQQLWMYEWGVFDAGNLFWESPPGFGGVRATVDVAQSLFAGHVYELTLYTGTFSRSGHGQEMTMQLSGLATVPEPSSLLLVVTGLIGAGVHRWRRRTDSTASPRSLF